MTTTCQQISLAYSQAFYPETLKYNGRLGPLDNQQVYIHLTPDHKPQGWIASIVGVAFQFFAYLSNVSLPSKIVVSVHDLEKTSFEVGKRSIEIKVDPTEIVPSLTKRDTIYLESNREALTGYVGTEAQNNMKRRLFKEDKTSPFTDPFDFYVPMKISSDPERSPIDLPASLFAEKKEGDKVRFILDGEQHEVTLKQQSHPIEAGQQNFEDFLEVLGAICREQNLFRYPADTPENLLTLNGEYLDRLDAYDLQEKTLVQEDQEALEKIKKWKEECKLFDVLAGSETQICLGASAMKLENLTVYVSPHRLFLYGERPSLFPESLGENYKVLTDEIPKKLFFNAKLLRPLDLSKTEFFFQEGNGVLQLNLAFEST